jgi:Zn2+/Cd2+-exporting ATPase
VIATTIAGTLLAAGYITSVAGGPATAVRVLYGISILFGGYYPVRTAIYSAANRSLDTNLLMSVAAAGAIALNEFLEAGMVLFLFSLGSALESYTVEKTRRSIRSLLDLSPSYALVRRDNSESLLPVENVEVGDTVIVKPGERISMDGIVSMGASAVDQSPITGESVPVEKTAGEQVYAGTVNGRGALEITVTRLVEDNTLSRIIHLVEEAQSQKAPLQRFSERFGQIYTPIVIGSAIMLAIVPWAVFGADFSEWFLRSLILLVVACPCALVISTPVAVVAAIGNAARNGVLVKGGAHLEELGRVSVIAFDKTGTLTTGRLEVTDVLPLNDVSPGEVLSVAAAVESRSEHPLAEAIIRRAAEEGVISEDVSYFEALPGRGARAVAGERLLYVGNHRLLDELKLAPPHIEQIANLWDAGKTFVYVGVEDRIIGVIAAADRIKESSARAIEGLRRTGIQRIIMLTGDNAATARAIAKPLAIDEVRAELLPEDKVEVVRKLVQSREKVAMVGDGINDAPALAAANVGIAMGGAGTHAALETADMALTADDLTMLPYGIELSRRTLRVIKQNIAFSMLVVILLIGSTLAGFLTLTGGVLGHEGSALLVIANSMRLLPRRY